MKVGTNTALKKAFKGLEQSTLETLRAVAQRRHYPPRTVLCRQGERGDTFYVIVAGRVAVTQVLESGEDRLLGVLGPRNYFGEMALIDDTPRMATCTTMLPTTVLEITEAVFDQLVEESPALAYTITHRVLEMMRHLDRLTIGELMVKNDALERAYSELQAAQEALVVKERLLRELELAADMQRSLLPQRLPRYPRYQFSTYLKPARQVGGDFYDVLPLDEAHVGLLMADVADKGFHAALFMAVTHTLFRGSCHESLSPAAVAVAVHERMFEGLTGDVFVTAVYGVLHRPSGRLTYVRAGHDRPLLYRPGQPVQTLPGEGRFLGMLPDLQLQEHSIQLQAGDRLIFFSDGVPDAINQAGEPYGLARLTAVITQYGELPASQLKQKIVDDVANWCQDAPPFDDLTLLVMEVREGK